MIDTIKLYIPCSSQDIQKIQKKCQKTKREHLNTGKIEYEYYHDPVEFGSFKHTIVIRPSETYSGLFVEFSMPKYVYGNNVEMLKLSEILPTLELFKIDTENHFGVELENVEAWEVWRLDVCYNWTFESKEKAYSLMNFIQRIDYPRKKKYIYDTSVMYKGSAYTIKFYLKGPEFRKHDKKRIETIDDDIAFDLAKWADNMLRFEVEFRKTQLKELFINDLSLKTIPLEELNKF